jgi:hypothetical protein
MADFKILKTQAAIAAWRKSISSQKSRSDDVVSLKHTLRISGSVRTDAQPEEIQDNILFSDAFMKNGCIEVAEGAFPPDDRLRGPRSARSMTYWSMPVCSDRRVGCLENG